MLGLDRCRRVPQMIVAMPRVTAQMVVSAALGVDGPNLMFGIRASTRRTAFRRTLGMIALGHSKSPWFSIG
jgi:hypothetical protein